MTSNPKIIGVFAVHSPCRVLGYSLPNPYRQHNGKAKASPPFLQYVIPAIYLPLPAQTADIKPIPRLNHIPLPRFMHLDFYHHVAWRKALFQDLHVDAVLKIRYEVLRLGNLCSRNLRDICYPKILKVIFERATVEKIRTIA